jgi:hypothetical protein
VTTRWGTLLEAVAGDPAHTVAWGDAVMTITAATPLIVTQETMPDCTLRVLSEDENHNLYTCIVVQTTESVRQAQITMQVSSPGISTE